MQKKGWKIVDVWIIFRLFCASDRVIQTLSIHRQFSTFFASMIFLKFLFVFWSIVVISSYKEKPGARKGFSRHLAVCILWQVQERIEENAVTTPLFSLQNLIFEFPALISDLARVFDSYFACPQYSSSLIWSLFTTMWIFIGWLGVCLISAWSQNVHNVRQKCENMIQNARHYTKMTYGFDLWRGTRKNSSRVFGFQFLGANSKFRNQADILTGQ